VLVTSRSMPWTGKKESAARAKIALIWTMVMSVTVIGNDKNKKQRVEVSQAEMQKTRDGFRERRINTTEKERFSRTLTHRV
jgi:hypothetical protein